MNIDAFIRLVGKRFFGLLVCAGALVAGYFYGDPAVFPSFATTIGLMYGVYVGGQSYTDAKKP